MPATGSQEQTETQRILTREITELITTTIQKTNESLIANLTANFDKSVSQIKRAHEEANVTQTKEIKKLKLGENRVFKRRGNEVQHKFNARIEATMNDAKDAIQAKNPTKALESLDEGTNLIQERQKLILLADKSEFGWKTAAEYELHELAADETDAKKIRRAEERAEKALKAESSKRKAKKQYIPQRGRIQGVSQPGSSGLQTSVNPAQFNVGNRRSGSCYACGRFGHWRANCPTVFQSSTGTMMQDDVQEFIEMDVEETEQFENDIFQQENANYEVDSKLKFTCSVKGSLKRSIEFWKDGIHSSEFIIGTIEQGYKIPFHTDPPFCDLKNNKSAYEHSSFVNEAILDLLSDGRVEEVLEKPDYINPLSVSVQSSGKKRLIIDLRHINLFVFKQKFKCEDLATLREVSRPGNFFFTFDLKSGYHHLDIFPGHRKFLSFSWCLNSINWTNPRYFQFTVLPFGLSSAPFIFTKLMRPIVTHCRSLGIPGCIYLDDGICSGETEEKCLLASHKVKSTLKNLGFITNEEKSFWKPSPKATWLGCVIDSSSGIIKATSKRIDKLQSLLDDVCDTINSNNFCTIKFNVRSLASIVGNIVSLHSCCGNVTRIMSRYLHFVINSRENWKSIVTLDAQAYRELVFWRTNLESLNGIPFWKNCTIPGNIVYSDASSSGCGAHVNFDNRVFQANWTDSESLKSSTWRELRAVFLALSAYVKQMKNQNITWYSDNQNVVTIIECGSKVRELQDLALEVFLICQLNKVCLTPLWLPRDLNTKADEISKIIDYDDYSLKDEIFSYLDGLWGPHTVDRFACFYNAKVDRFNSRFFQPSTEAVDAFQQNWAFDTNWLVPPISRIGRTIHHMLTQRARGSLIVPMWKSAYFWTLLCNDGVHWNTFIHDWVVLPAFSEAFVIGKAKNKFLTNNPNRSPVVALYIDAYIPPRVTSAGEFCTSTTCHEHTGNWDTTGYMTEEMEN